MPSAYPPDTYTTPAPAAATTMTVLYTPPRHIDPFRFSREQLLVTETKPNPH